MEKIGPWSITALLATLVLLFAFQGKAIIEQPLVIALLAVPILIQVFFNSSLAYWLNKKVGEKHSVACPSALIGASNFFELAVAAAISLFGFESGAALATVVGVLIEVPVMLLVVKVVNASKDWYEQPDRHCRRRHRRAWVDACHASRRGDPFLCLRHAQGAVAARRRRLHHGHRADLFRAGTHARAAFRPHGSDSATCWRRRWASSRRSVRARRCRCSSASSRPACRSA
jgi:hypothetical protein